MDASMPGNLSALDQVMVEACLRFIRIWPSREFVIGVHAGPDTGSRMIVMDFNDEYILIQRSMHCTWADLEPVQFKVDFIYDNMVRTAEAMVEAMVVLKKTEMS